MIYTWEMIMELMDTLNGISLKFQTLEGMLHIDLT